MSGYNFLRRSDIEETIRRVRDSRHNLATFGVEHPEHLGPRPPEQLTYGFIFFTPTYGIPARVGTQCGSAPCVQYYIDSEGVLKELLKDDGTVQEHVVYHIGSADVEPSRFIQAKLSYNRLVADMEDCG